MGLRICLSDQDFNMNSQPLFVMSEWERLLEERLATLEHPPEYTSGELIQKLSEDGPNPYKTPPPSQQLKQKVRYRDQFKCRFCNNGRVRTASDGANWRSESSSEQFSSDKPNQEIARRYLSVHHIVPRSNGGRNELENMITLCDQCHLKLHEERIARGNTIESNMYRDGY